MEGLENQRRAVLIRDLREVEAADLIHNFLKTKKSFTNQGILRKKLLRGCSSHMSILQFFCPPWPTKIIHSIIEINLKELWSQQERRGGAIKDQRNLVIPVAGVPICYS